MFEPTQTTETSQKFSVSCYDVPSSLLHKNAAKNHFQKFGKIVRIILRPKRNQCVIEFDKNESARKALHDSGFYDGKSFKTAWTQSEKGKRQTKLKEKDPDWTSDPDVKSELDAMRGSFSSNRTYTLRSEVMAVDPVITPTKIISKDAKKLRNWRTEKSVKKKPETTSSLFSNDQTKDLFHVMTKCARNSEDKFRVLDARDKLIRLKIARQSNLANTGHTVGTCPDMCPEKERLMREAQHQVALYEQLISGKNNQMNHAIGVKQYSRSSADQEAPLAHELRPVAVLELTMGYLLHCIMDLCDSRDVNLAEWFHFLWDRMRGIRKDITQQELCCQGSVKLVEQCARFHIHCSARLVAEDVSVFDQKINTENLTKCLQTLKYMYHDLSLKNERCPNEAEFRGYIVLLNLNDGNFMWEVQQLSPEIQCSPEVKFAMAVYSALDKNNYVRFFKLVKSTTYLNACILLRYFNQVRIRALSRIIKSYSPRQLFTQFPVTEFCNILAFEDIVNTVSFMEYHGMCLNPEKTHVILDRKMFQQPDISFLLERAINVIESKRACSVGEIVCGTTLPGKHFQNHVPHNSFDESGHLKASEIPKEWQAQYVKYLADRTNEDELEEDLLLKDEEDNEVVEDLLEKPFTFSDPVSVDYEAEVQVNVPQATSFVFQLPEVVSREVSQVDSVKPSTPAFVKTTTNIFGNTATKTEPAKSVFELPPLSKPKIPIVSQFNDFIKNFTVSQATPFGAVKPVREPEKSDVFGNIETIVFQKPEAPSLPANQKKFVFDNRMSVDEAFIGEPKPTVKSTYGEAMQVDKPETVIPALVQQSKEDEERILNEEKEKQRLREIQEENLRKSRELLIQKMEILQKEKELENKRSMEVMKTLNYILTKVEEQVDAERWIEALANKLRMKKVLLFVQKWRDSINRSKRKRKNFFDHPTWVSSRSVTAEAQELYIPSQSLTLHDIKRYKSGVSQNVKVQKSVMVNKLSIFKLAWKIIFEKLNNGNDSLKLDIYWKVGISLPMKSDSSVALHALEHDLQCAFDWNDEQNVSINRYIALNGGTFTKCIQEITDFDCIDTYNGILFFEVGKITDQTSKRLNQLFSYSKGKMIPVPLTINLKNCSNSKEEVKEKLKLQELIKSHYICDYEIYFLEKESIDSTLADTLQWLASNTDVPPPLEQDVLPTTICNCVAGELRCRLRSSAYINERLWVLLKDPNVVIQLHNEAILRLTKVLCDPSLSNYRRFPREFKMFLDEQNVSMPCSYEYFSHHWNEESHFSKIKSILQSLVLPSYDFVWPSKGQFCFELDMQMYCSKVIKNGKNIPLKILSAIYRKQESRPHDDFQQIINETLWLDILEVIVNEQLNQISFTDENDRYIVCGYNIEHMNNLRKLPWWYHFKLISTKIKEVVIEDKAPETDNETRILYSDYDDIDLDETLAKLYEEEDNAKTNNLELAEELMQISVVIDDLQKSMDIQKKIVSRFEETTRVLMSNRK